jgi:hypothetical protein
MSGLQGHLKSIEYQCLSCQEPTLRPGLRTEGVAPFRASPADVSGAEPYGRQVADDLMEQYGDLLTGSYDCVDRIMLNAYYPPGHNPGGFQVWRLGRGSG